jgi:predicted transcriptional regulator
MNAVYRLQKATVAEVIAELPDAPSYSAVRALLGILEQKGQLQHHQDGARYVYQPVLSRSTAQQGALKTVLQTFFNGSRTQAIAALLELSDSKLSKQEQAELTALIGKARKEGR